MGRPNCLATDGVNKTGNWVHKGGWGKRMNLSSQIIPLWRNMSDSINTSLAKAPISTTMPGGPLRREFGERKKGRTQRPSGREKTTGIPCAGSKRVNASVVCLDGGLTICQKWMRKAV